MGPDRTSPPATRGLRVGEVLYLSEEFEVRDRERSLVDNGGEVHSVGVTLLSIAIIPELTRVGFVDDLSALLDGGQTRGVRHKALGARERRV